MSYNWRYETTGDRTAEVKFRDWHRKTFGAYDYASDIDLILYNRRTLHAVVEIKSAHVRKNNMIKKNNMYVLLDIAQAKNVPFLIIWYDYDNQIFYVYEAYKEEDLDRYDESLFDELVSVYNEKQMQEYLTNLRLKR